MVDDNILFFLPISREDEYVAKGIRIGYSGEISPMPSNFSQSLEPEYVTYNNDEAKAYIAIQVSQLNINLITRLLDFYLTTMSQVAITATAASKLKFTKISLQYCHDCTCPCDTETTCHACEQKSL